ncbi:MAG: PIN domain-containing protein [Candidatus Hydrogenedentes bacterium]|nr:PIN domain-containing protein [Candidatus Hydrogenedentota bacterium]
MNCVFADTSYYFALANPRDSAHGVAKAFSDEYEGKIYTTEYVLVELGNGMSRQASRSAFVALYDSLILDEQTTIIAGNSDLVERAVRLYGARLDKEWSLVDCTSFVAMQHHGIQESLTTDRHFKQAGFSALLSRT